MDIQQIANEYSRLIGMRFVLGLEDGTVINLAFTMKDFYHLLGFEKFEDASIIKMIENNAFYKEKFFKAVKNGKITFTETKLRLKNANRYYVDGKWNELCDSENLQNASLVINNRFPYFSYENIKMLLQEELVALYNTDLAPDWRKISADKLFFHLMLKENKNLNLFIRNIDEGKKDCPVSFFLEQIKDEYLKTKNGCEEALQKRIKITFRGIYTNGTRISEYSPFWDKIRFYYSKNNIPELYVAQRKIQEYFASGTVVTTENAKEKLEEKRTELQVLVDKLNVLEEKSGLIEEIALWSSKVGEEKEEAAIEIIEKYGVDVEKDDIECIKGEHIQTISQIHNIKARITVINKQIKKFEKYMDTLEELEIAEVRYGYRYFMPEIDNADKVFIKMLINNGVFKKMMLPDEVKKQYGLFEH